MAAPRPQATTLYEALRRVCADLESITTAYALVGGLAVSARAQPRTTRDVDLVVSVADDREAEGITLSLTGRGYRVVTVIEQSSTKRLATVRLAPPGASGLVVDLLFASSGIEREIAKAAERVMILPGLEVPLARTGHLIAMKLLARDDRDRPQDADDLRALLAVASTVERRRVSSAVKLIAARGFARGRDLAALWRIAQRG